MASTKEPELLQRKNQNCPRTSTIDCVVFSLHQELSGIVTRSSPSQHCPFFVRWHGKLLSMRSQVSVELLQILEKLTFLGQRAAGFLFRASVQCPQATVPAH
eukprot:TRINITY_DN94597_c0_g1_i1.p1 TRINITY_DN94597_c0_g1~~TRINITY_DN94597_c0_g1_i1.p1  ORF type:complete len:102 (+),score=9.32 TRINITY_DN94597_c0_g1_i1:96-401(+)